MYPNLATISALCLLVAFGGWSRDDPLPFVEISVPNKQYSDSVENSTWGSYLGAWFESFGVDNCNCGLGNVHFPTDGATGQTVDELVNWVSDTAKPSIQRIPTYRDKVKRSMFDKLAETPGQNSKNKMVTGNDRKYKMAAFVLRNSDVVVFLTSVFQVCWILRMVVWKGLCPRKMKNTSCQTGIPNHSIPGKNSVYNYDFAMDEMRKTLKRLTEDQGHQERVLQQKEDEIEHLARTVEYINRKSAAQQQLLKQRIVVVEAIARRILSLQRHGKESKDHLLKSNPCHITEKGGLLLANRRYNNNSSDDGGGDMDIMRVESELEWDF